MRNVILDGRRMESREVFHKTIAAELGFPGWYGKNLDALYDCLTELREDTRLCILCPQALKDQLGFYGEKILITLRQAQAETDRLTVSLQESEEENRDTDTLAE